MKNRVLAALILLGLTGVAACAPTETIKRTLAATPDQTETSISVEASAEAGFRLTEEANVFLESAMSATETQLASVATDTAPTSLAATSLAPTPTDTPTSVPASTSTPTPPSSPTPYPFPFSKPLPIRWEGLFFQDSNGILEIEKIWTGGRFSGIFNFLGTGDVTAINGIIVEEIPEFELGKWEQIEDFDTDIGVTQIRFVESSVIQGNPDSRLDGLYLALVNQEGVMRGLYFYNHDTFEPFNPFEFSLTE